MPLFRHPSHGFRLSPSDLIILILGLGASIFGRDFLADYAVLPAFVVLHFFLFCNVFRIARNLELIWTAVFIVNFFVTTTLLGKPPLIAMAAQIPITIAVIAREIMHLRYHGIFAKQ